ncbi:MAG: nodulation protein NfeD [Chloroflexi bacterium]|nr:nodulation protein NfeD [Chloroflexota bacterium]
MRFKRGLRKSQGNLMKRYLARFLIAIGFGGLIVALSLQTTVAVSHHAALLTIDGAIDPVSVRFLERGIAIAVDEGAELLIVQLDTPGGRLDSTREIVEAFLVSEVPIVVFVSPPGAQAASAGTFVTAAAHIAAMAPTTNIGAASPVGPGGEDLPETINSKITEDTAAFIRTIAEERGRNADALEATVLEAKSYTATEAIQNDIIDVVAADIEELLVRLDGMTVALEGRQVVLDTKDIDVRRINRTPVERFLGFLANPNVAFLLFSIGGLGILLELLNPGMIAPGLFGVIALSLSFLAFGSLPVNWVGVGLIILALVLFFAEVQAPGIGVFGVGGAISFVLGAFLLFGELTFRPQVPPLPGAPSIGVSLWVIGIAAGLISGVVFFLAKSLRSARLADGTPYQPSLVGRIGVATATLDPGGAVRIAGEAWTAVSDSKEKIAEGDRVIVSEVDGLTLKVFRAPENV